MNEKFKEYSIKVILTIPAIVVGLLTSIVLILQLIAKIPPIAFILKPAKDLWFPPVKPTEEEIRQLKEQEELSKHTFY